jgi:hypothetical protein
MTHYMYILWSLFATQTNGYYDQVEAYCPSYTMETSATVCDVNLSLIEQMSDKEYKDYVSDCLSKKSKMFLL